MKKRVWAHGKGESRRACGQKRYGFGYYAIWSNKQGREPADIHVARCKATQTFDMTFRCICMVGVRASPPRPPSTPLKPPGPPSTPRRSPTSPPRSRRPPRPPSTPRTPPRSPLCACQFSSCLFVLVHLSPKVKKPKNKSHISSTTPLHHFIQSIYAITCDASLRKNNCILSLGTIQRFDCTKT